MATPYLGVSENTLSGQGVPVNRLVLCVCGELCLLAR